MHSHGSDDVPSAAATWAAAGISSAGDKCTRLRPD
jgi:hypothetical protein